MVDYENVFPENMGFGMYAGQRTYRVDCTCGLDDCFDALLVFVPNSWGDATPSLEELSPYMKSVCWPQAYQAMADRANVQLDVMLTHWSSRRMLIHAKAMLKAAEKFDKGLGGFISTRDALDADDLMGDALTYDKLTDGYDPKLLQSAFYAGYRDKAWNLVELLKEEDPLYARYERVSAYHLELVKQKRQEMLSRVHVVQVNSPVEIEFVDETGVEGAALESGQDDSQVVNSNMPGMPYVGKLGLLKPDDADVLQ